MNIGEIWIMVVVAFMVLMFGMLGYSILEKEFTKSICQDNGYEFPYGERDKVDGVEYAKCYNIIEKPGEDERVYEWVRME